MQKSIIMDVTIDTRTRGNRWGLNRTRGQGDVRRSFGEKAGFDIRFLDFSIQPLAPSRLEACRNEFEKTIIALNEGDG